MPTIDLKSNQSANTTTPATPPANNWGGWNDPWQDDSTDEAQNNPNQKRMTPQERVGMIEKAYQEVLARNPDTRDINYYKYSTLTEEEIKKQLITGTEHKQLLEDGRDYKKLKERALQAETRVKLLEGQIIDQIEEFKQLTNLLKEKNRHITEIRERLNNGAKPTTPFSPKTFEAQPVINSNQQTQEGSVHFTNSAKPTIKAKVNKTLVERIKKTLKDML